MTRRVRALLAVLALLLVAVSACSSPPPHHRTKTTSADRRANLAVLKMADLPDGWAAVSARSRLDGSPGKPVYCGVAAQPSPLREGRLAYYEQTSTGRAVLEYAMVGTSSGATKVLDKLREVATACPSANQKLRLVTQAVDVGDQTVAWDAVSGQGTRSRVMIFRSRDTVVALIAFGATSVPVNEQQAIAGTIASELS